MIARLQSGRGEHDGMKHHSLVAAQISTKVMLH